MWNLAEGIDSLTNFKRQTPEFISRLRKSGEPVVLTVNGRAEVVVQDASAYQRLVEAARQASRDEAIAEIKEGLADVAAGRTKPMREMVRSLAKKHRLRLPRGAS